MKSIQRHLRIGGLVVWWRRDDVEERRRRDVRKNWHLVRNHPHEDPERHINEGRSGTETADPSSPLPVEMARFQEEVLGWLEMGMLSWFNFYFVLGPGSMDDRLTEVSEGLGKASESLHAIGARMEYLCGENSASRRPVEAYRQAVADWGESLDLIGKGAQLDLKSLAQDGFSLMGAATACAESIVDVQAGPSPGVEVDGRLDALRRMRPPKRVPRKALERAKAPWREAMVAAGSRIDWPH